MKLPKWTVVSVAVLLAWDVSAQTPPYPRTRVSIRQGRWFVNDEVTYPGAQAEGLLMNVRMVNAVFEDRNRPEFDPDANTDEFIARIPDYVAHGVRAFTSVLQGGMPGYEGAVNSAFRSGRLACRDPYMRRVRRVIEACDRRRRRGHPRLLLPASGPGAQGRGRRPCWRGQRREMGQRQRFHECHAGDRQRVRPWRIRPPPAQDGRGDCGTDRVWPRRPRRRLLVSASGLGHGQLADRVAEGERLSADPLQWHAGRGNPRPHRGAEKFGKPIVCNEDEKVGEQGAKAAETVRGERGVLGPHAGGREPAFSVHIPGGGGRSAGVRRDQATDGGQQIAPDHRNRRGRRSGR